MQSHTAEQQITIWNWTLYLCSKILQRG